MFELSLHILDLVQNSISAGASIVRVEIIIDRLANRLTILIIDDGSGMDEALLQRVTSPFATTRTTRKVGLGIPMFKQLSEMCGGALELTSAPGKGTRLVATFELNHMDLPPLGDIAGTVQTLVLGAPDKPEFVFVYRVLDGEFIFDTREVRVALGGLPLNMPDVISWIGDCVKEGMAEAQSGQIQ